jgi:hypothetical protein
MSRDKRQYDFARIWFIVSIAVAVFAYGVAVGRYHIFPFRILNFGVSSLLQLREEFHVLIGRRPSWHITTARHEGEGVTVLQADKISPGLTLLAGMFEGENQLRLIEPDGTPVRIWPVHYTQVFPRTSNPEHRSTPRGDWNVQIHGALAMPDGSVLMNFDYAGTVKYNRCGEVEWTLREPTHHSIERSSDGGFWIPSRVYSNVVAGFPWSESGYEEDLILRVSEAGEVLESVRIAELFVKNDLLHLMLLKGPGPIFRSGEILHLNDIEELPDSIADVFPAFEATDLVLSFRDENLVMVVGSRDWKVKWYQMGPWIGQHDPDFQSDGTITIFNNKNDNTPGGTHLGGSEIVELNPVTGATRVLYGGIPDQEMHTGLLGKHQMLPNGNILITQALSGRVLEVTRAGEIVWELINRHDEEMVAVVTQATRYPPSYFEVDDWTCSRDNERGN